MKQLLQNWKTTSAGLTMIVGSVVHLVFAARAGTANENTWTISLTAVIGGAGLILAGDASQSANAQDVAKAIETGDTTTLKKPQP